MLLERPTLSSLSTRIQSDIETRLPEAGSLLRRSVLKVVAKVLAGACHLLYGYLDYQAKQVFASTANEKALDTIANEYGISRTAATYASGTAVANGTSGTEIPENTELQNSDGYVYLVNDDFTVSGGTVNITFIAKYAGVDYNDDANVTLSFVSPITGVNSTVTVDSSGIVGGADSESNDNLRERILTRKRIPPHGGTSNDYINWMKEVSGVTRAWCISQWAGNGTTLLVFVRDNDTTIIPTSTQASTMLTYITSHSDPASGETTGAPVSALAGLYIMSSSGAVYDGGTVSSYTLATSSKDFTIQIYPNTTAVQEAVEAELEAILLSDGGPGETIKLSRLTEAIGNAAGEQYHRITSPTSDITSEYTEIPILGTVTFEDYT